MFAIILTYIILLFAIVGLTFSIEALWFYLLNPKNAPKRSVIIYLDESTAKMQINEIIEELKWRGDKNIKNIFIINNNLEHNDFINLKNEFNNDKLVFINKTEIYDWKP